MSIHDPDDPVWLRIADCLDEPIQTIRRLSHGGFSSTFKVSCGSTQYFVKFCEDFDALASEYDGLSALADSHTIRVPRPVLLESLDPISALAVEFIELEKPRSRYHALADKLHAMHSQHGTAFGWHRNNYIGQSPQVNTQCNNWLEFFLNHRIMYQLELAFQNGYLDKTHSLGERLPDAVTEILRHHQPKPSLLHGDLWYGNLGFDPHGTPIIFDPAVYFGDFETDLAMTALFGGLPNSFYSMYQNLHPMADDWKLRESVYNLYHILNHLNIFGRGYLSHAKNLMASIVSEVR